MPISPSARSVSARYFLGAIILTVAGFLVNVYLPARTVAYWAVVMLLLTAAVLFLIGLFALVVGPRRREPPLRRRRWRHHHRRVGREDRGQP